jgi:PAS domain S-box-containing protein
LNNSEKSLKELSDYKFALDQSSIVAITDQKGIIKYVNETFCKISQYSTEELIGQDHRLINSGYHPKEFIRSLWVTIANGQTWRGEIKNRAKDGSYYWVDTTIIPFLDESKKPYQYVAIRFDITERKKIEEEFRLLNEQLETRVQLRTEELEAFSYSVSHDLRAPLRAVNGYAQILEEDYSDKLDDEGNRLLGVIRDNAKKMGNLIDDLLAFSGLGRKQLMLTRIDMNELVKNLLSETGKIQIDHAEVKYNNLHEIYADYSLIHQVMMNLISNSIKYSAKVEKPVIEINSAIEKNQYVFSVKDNGAGFDMRYYDKLFGVFQRLHTGTEFEGTGVGLAIVKRIVDKHGGKVWGNGEVGKGAIFYFSIPKNHKKT